MTPMQVRILKSFHGVEWISGGSNQKEGLCFVFVSVQKYSKQQAFGLLKTDTVFFLYNRNSITDTLFGIAASDRGIQ